jgi:PPOX class probable F420-dependent enzyme
VDVEAALEFIRSRHQGVLVTMRRDGRPQMSNIAYRVGADGVIRISVTADRAKTKNLARDPRASLYVSRDDFWAYAVIDGRAELSPVAARPDDSTVDELVDLYRSLQGEHPDWDEYRTAMVSDRRLVVRMRPERAYGMLPQS